MPFIEANDGTRLFYQDWGSGKPLLFIHGWCLGASMWEYQMTPLAEQGLRCVAYDARGCGRSDQPDRGYDFDTLAGDLAALLARLDLRDATLVGHSMGAGVAARHLSRHGAGRVARVVLISTIPPFAPQTADHPDGAEQGAAGDMIAALRHDRPGFASALAGPWFGVGLPGVSVSPALVQWGIGLFLQASPKAAVEMLRTTLGADLRPDLRAVTVPTLIVHGAEDIMAPLERSGRQAAEAIPHSQLTVYEHASHGLFVSHKERLNGDLRAFVRV